MFNVKAAFLLWIRNRFELAKDLVVRRKTLFLASACNARAYIDNLRVQSPAKLKIARQENRAFLMAAFDPEDLFDFSNPEDVEEYKRLNQPIQRTRHETAKPRRI
jgi:hypothetical protein